MLAIFNNDSAGPTLEVGFSAAQPNIVTAISPPANTVWVRAIADTGAMSTCICHSVAERADLPVIGQENMRSASHVVPVNKFFGDLWVRGRLAGGGGSLFTWPFRNRSLFELALPGLANEALLGMDVMKEGMLVVHGPGGHTTFSW